MIEIQHLPPEAIYRLGEIDRTEQVTSGYTYANGELKAETVEWNVPNWHKEDRSGGHSIPALMRGFKPIMDAGGVLVGALDGDKLAGIALLRYKLTDTLAQLAGLFVSHDYRRQGIACRLTAEVIRLAREDGAKGLYVSATPSESAVGFYLSQGFRPTNQPHPELLALEPKDIHMVLPL
jgi:ribosomal protein S18 acetylase RimI-like enzyme